jgi:DNA-binding MarR family transcriptional regulator
MRIRKLTPETSQSQRMRRKAATFARHRLRVLELLAGKPEGETVRHFRDRLILGTPKVRAVLRSLLDDGLIVPSRLDKHERRESGFRIWGTRR